MLKVGDANATQADVDAEEAMIEAATRPNLKDTLIHWTPTRPIRNCYVVLSPTRSQKGYKRSSKVNQIMLLKSERTLCGYYKGSDIIALAIKPIDTFLQYISMPSLA